MELHYLDKLLNILSDFDQKVWLEQKVVGIKDIRNEHHLQQLNELYQLLGGQGNFLNIPSIDHYYIHFDEQKKVLKLDDETYFNRYRATTLQADFYNSWEGVDAKSFILHCRKKEQDCLKSAGKQALWTSPAAEICFGLSTQSPDFSGNGAVGWKLKALQACLTDMYWREQKNIQYLRISLHDKLMVSSKIQSIKDLLIHTNQDNFRAVANSILRRFKLSRIEKTIKE